MTQLNEKIEETLEITVGRLTEENARLHNTINMLNEERRRDKEWNRKAFEIIYWLSRTLSHDD